MGIKAPIAFTSTSTVGFVIDADNVSIDLGDNIPLETATLNLTASNTIPLNFELEVTAKDKDKKPITGVTATVDKKIAAGFGVGNATDTPIKITLNITKGASSIKGLELKLKASSDAAAAGRPLEPEQGIHLHDVSLKLPQGITTDLNNLGK